MSVSVDHTSGAPEPGDPTAAAPETPVERTPTQLRRALRRFVRMPVPMLALVWIVLMILVAVFGEALAPHDPYESLEPYRPLAGPSAESWLGTDHIGRDVFSRVLVGTRVSVLSGFVVTGLSLVMAIPLGLLAGYIGGTFDLVLLRVMDALRSFPGLVLVLSITVVLGPSLWNAMFAISVVIVPGFVRLIRGQALSLREETFVEASQAIGTPRRTILRKRIIPGVLSPLIVSATLLLGVAMLIEAGLSFLGFGQPPPTPSWGNMLEQGFQRIFSHPSQSMYPGVAIALAVLAFNLAGDGLRDALGLVEHDRGKGSLRNRMGITSAQLDRGVAAQPAETPAEEPLLSVRDLRVDFATPSGTVTVVDGVGFDVWPGEVVGLVGESGCGKSVTSSAIMRIIPSPPGRVRTGQVLFEGRDLLSLPFEAMRRVRSNEIAMVFQDPMSSLNPGYTIGNQLIEVIRMHQDLARDEARQLALDMLDRVQMPNPQIVMKQYAHNLSGGMRQRVLIAMALVNSPKLLIADEPTTALDVTVQAQILELLKDLQREMGMAVIFVTHDLGVVADICDRVQVMYAGEIVESTSVDELFAQPRHPYTRALLTAMPQSTHKSDRLVSIPGTVPPPAAWPVGCHFSTRCDHVREECRLGEIPLEGSADHRIRCIRHRELEPELDRRAEVETVGSEIEPRPIEPPGDVLVQGNDLKMHFPIQSSVLRRTVGYVQAVDGVDISLPKGATLGLVGESGSGKSTLGRLVMRLLEPTAGSLSFEGEDVTSLKGRRLRALRRDMQMIFQDPYASMDPRSYVGDSVAEPLRTHLDLRGDALTRRVTELFETVNLSPSYRARFPHEFSGGQLQRLAVARALATDPALIVCDEPVSSLDVSTQAEVINLLEDLQDELGLTYLFISHDLSVVRHLCERISVMYLGRIVEEGPSDTVYEHPRHPYTQALLSAIPIPDPGVQRSRRRIVLSGDLPSPANPPTGCRFRTRCPEAMDVCTHIDPPQAITADGVKLHCHLHPPTEEPVSIGAAGAGRGTGS